MKKFAFAFLILGIFYFYSNRNSHKPADGRVGDEIVQSSINDKHKNRKAKPNLDANVGITQTEDIPIPIIPIELTNGTKPPSKQIKPASDATPLLTYVIDDGLAVIQGDIIIGEVSQDTLLKSLSGNVNEPSLQIWPTTEIPYFIQPNLSSPDRVLQALAFFSGTNVHFVPYVDQEDAIVFEQGMGACKSYLGYIGGHQKIILSNGCSPKEIAHEIMHSLGFLHEQNRTDRDSYVNVLWDNVDPKFRINFEKFSSAMMKVSGLTQFDFESLMIYPENMFSINNHATMKPKLEGQSISPSHGLSAKDIERINKTY